ncbi:MAG: hypothetical protein GXP62_09175 [Oligoflexia bacterium]|nr:hypothetical protein [Oligoflexia bacterium]
MLPAAVLLGLPASACAKSTHGAANIQAFVGLSFVVGFPGGVGVRAEFSTRYAFPGYLGSTVLRPTGGPFFYGELLRHGGARAALGMKAGVGGLVFVDCTGFIPLPEIDAIIGVRGGNKTGTGPLLGLAVDALAGHLQVDLAPDRSLDAAPDGEPDGEPEQDQPDSAPRTWSKDLAVGVQVPLVVACIE